MRRAPVRLCRVAACAALVGAVLLSFARLAAAQGKTYERKFHQSASDIRKILDRMQGSMQGHLPVLDGFVAAGSHPLDSYERPFFQANVEVSSNPDGGAIVHVSAKITAWYADPGGSRSGYQLLNSNGRIEADILDQISDLTAAAAPNPNNGPNHRAAEIEVKEPAKELPQPATAPATPPLPEAPSSLSSSFSQSLANQGKAPLPADAKPVDPEQARLQAELEQLQELLKNQVHPKNLAAVKKSGTAVVPNASLSAKPLFLASAHDEFEILNFTKDWVHVKVSGLSRGWIWRNDLEMPGEIPDTQAVPAPPTAADLFRVVREEAAPFPGDWEPLRGKTVKVISVQKTDDSEKDGGPQMKLEFAKSLFAKNYAELAQKSASLAGIVLIFDSADGGMIAAQQVTLEKWKAGSLSDAALWHSCFFDPPETFLATGSSGSQ